MIVRIIQENSKRYNIFRRVSGLFNRTPEEDIPVESINTATLSEEALLKTLLEQQIAAKGEEGFGIREKTVEGINPSKWNLFRKLDNLRKSVSHSVKKGLGDTKAAYLDSTGSELAERVKAREIDVTEAITRLKSVVELGLVVSDADYEAKKAQKINQITGIISSITSTSNISSRGYAEKAKDAMQGADDQKAKDIAEEMVSMFENGKTFAENITQLREVLAHNLTEESRRVNQKYDNKTAKRLGPIGAVKALGTAAIGATGPWFNGIFTTAVGFGSGYILGQNKVDRMDAHLDIKAKRVDGIINIMNLAEDQDADDFAFLARVKHAFENNLSTQQELFGSPIAYSKYLDLLQKNVNEINLIVDNNNDDVTSFVNNFKNRTDKVDGITRGKIALAVGADHAGSAALAFAGGKAGRGALGFVGDRFNEVGASTGIGNAFGEGVRNTQQFIYDKTGFLEPNSTPTPNSVPSVYPTPETTPTPSPSIEALAGSPIEDPAALVDVKRLTNGENVLLKGLGLNPEDVNNATYRKALAKATELGILKPGEDVDVSRIGAGGFEALAKGKGVSLSLDSVPNPIKAIEILTPDGKSIPSSVTQRITGYSSEALKTIRADEVPADEINLMKKLGLIDDKTAEISYGTRAEALQAAAKNGLFKSDGSFDLAKFNSTSEADLKKFNIGPLTSESSTKVASAAEKQLDSTPQIIKDRITTIKSEPPKTFSELPPQEQVIAKAANPTKTFVGTESFDSSSRARNLEAAAKLEVFDSKGEIDPSKLSKASEALVKETSNVPVIQSPEAAAADSQSKIAEGIAKTSTAKELQVPTGESPATDTWIKEQLKVNGYAPNVKGNYSVDQFAALQKKLIAEGFVKPDGTILGKIPNSSVFNINGTSSPVKFEDLTPTQKTLVLNYGGKDIVVNGEVSPDSLKKVSKVLQANGFIDGDSKTLDSSKLKDALSTTGDKIKQPSSLDGPRRDPNSVVGTDKAPTSDPKSPANTIKPKNSTNLPRTGGDAAKIPGTADNVPRTKTATESLRPKVGIEEMMKGDTYSTKVDLADAKGVSNLYDVKLPLDSHFHGAISAETAADLNSRLPEGMDKFKAGDVLVNASDVNENMSDSTKILGKIELDSSGKAKVISVWNAESTPISGVSTEANPLTSQNFEATVKNVPSLKALKFPSGMTDEFRITRLRELGALNPQGELILDKLNALKLPDFGNSVTENIPVKDNVIDLVSFAKSGSNSGAFREYITAELGRDGVVPNFDKLGFGLTPEQVKNLMVTLYKVPKGESNAVITLDRLNGSGIFDVTKMQAMTKKLAAEAAKKTAAAVK